MQFAAHRFAQGLMTTGDLGDYVFVKSATLDWLDPRKSSGYVIVNDCGATSTTSSTIVKHTEYQLPGHQLVEPIMTLRPPRPGDFRGGHHSELQPTVTKQATSSSHELLTQSQIAGEQELTFPELTARSRSSVTSGIDVTPLHSIQVSPQHYLDQQLRVSRLATRLNLTFSREFSERYVRTFGFIDDSCEGFGSDLWLGMHRLLA